MKTVSSKASEYLDKISRRVTGDLHGEDLVRVAWLSSTLFFVVGGYWLLRSLKDPIMSTIDGVEYIPQAKIASLFVVFGLVIVCKFPFIRHARNSQQLFRQQASRHLAEAQALLFNGSDIWMSLRYNGHSPSSSHNRTS